MMTVDEIIKTGGEGVIMGRVRSTYERGRNESLLKFKVFIIIIITKMV